MNRKKKLRLIQLSLLTISLIIIYFTYYNQYRPQDKIIISEKEQEKIEKQFSNPSEGDTFYEISYSNFDFSGNRYILNAKEARSDTLASEKIYLKKVDATFYMKNNTILKVFSEKGLYNSQTLDTVFEQNVEAFYEGSELIASKAEFSNSKNFLIISDNVKVKDENGTLFADQLIFDIKEQTLNISSVKNDKINANINLK